MEKHCIDVRVAQIESEGVTFHYGAHIGAGMPVEELLDRYDAVVLAGGAGRISK